MLGTPLTLSREWSPTDHASGSVVSNRERVKMKKLVALVLIVLGAAMALDQTLGLLAGAHSDPHTHAYTPEALIWPLVMVAIGVKWRQER